MVTGVVMAGGLDDLGAFGQDDGGVVGQDADKLFAVRPSGSPVEAKDRFPRKSIFFLDTAQDIPRSWGVT